MEADQVISAIGDWGRWQRLHVVLVASATVFAAWPSLIITYTNAPSDYWCARPEAFKNVSVTEWRSMSSPLVKEGGKMVHDRCHVFKQYSTDNDNNNNDNNINNMEIKDLDSAGGEVVPCSSWEYDRNEFVLTTIQQWDLVCHREGYQNLAQSTFFAGMLVGTLSVGVISDRFGRRLTLVPCLLLTVLVGAVLPLAPDVQTFIALRFAHGLVKIGFFVTAFVWSMECVGGRWQTFVGIGVQFPWVAAWLSLCLFAWFAGGDWRVVQWVTSLPGVAALALWWIIPESPKWLLSVGRLDEAERIVKKIAKANGRALPEDWKLNPLNFNNNNNVVDPEKEEKDLKTSSPLGGMVDLFRRRNLALWTLVIFFNWFANSFVYYGLTLNSGGIGGSYQLNFLLNGIFELPAYSITLYVLLKCGRRVPYVVLLVTGSLCLLATTLIERDAYRNNWPLVALAVAGKFCVTGTFGVVYVYSAEVFPTVVRSAGVGAASVFARVGGAVAPYVGSLDKTFTPTVPIAIFGLTALAAGVTALLLPETGDAKLPDTLDEGNEAKRSMGSLRSGSSNNNSSSSSNDEGEEEKMRV